MFEVGKKYEIHFIEGGVEVTSWGTVEKYEHPLVKFQDEEIEADLAPSGKLETIKGEIFNVASLNFVKAIPQD
jgi:hypothetical protein